MLPQTSVAPAGRPDRTVSAARSAPSRARRPSAPRPGGGVAADSRPAPLVGLLGRRGARPAVCARLAVRAIPRAAALAAPARGEPPPAPRTDGRVNGGEIAGRVPAAVPGLPVRQASPADGARQPVGAIPVAATADAPAGRAVPLARGQHAGRQRPAPRIHEHPRDGGRPVAGTAPGAAVAVHPGADGTVGAQPVRTPLFDHAAPRRAHRPPSR